MIRWMSNVIARNDLTFSNDDPNSIKKTDDKSSVIKEPAAKGFFRTVALPIEMYRFRIIVLYADARFFPPPSWEVFRNLNYFK